MNQTTKSPLCPPQLLPVETLAPRSREAGVAPGAPAQPASHGGSGGLY